MSPGPRVRTELSLRGVTSARRAESATVLNISHKREWASARRLRDFKIGLSDQPPIEPPETKLDKWAEAPESGDAPVQLVPADKEKSSAGLAPTGWVSLPEIAYQLQKETGRKVDVFEHPEIFGAIARDLKNSAPKGSYGRYVTPDGEAEYFSPALAKKIKLRAGLSLRI